MMDSIKEESVAYLFNVEVQVAEPTPAPALQPVPVGQLLRDMAGRDDGGDTVRDADPADDGAAQDAAAGSAFRRPVIQAKGLDGPQAARLHYSAPSETGGTEERDVESAPSRSSRSGNPANRTQRRSSKKARRRGR
jgi:preprotein translocase subunit SecA